MIIRYWLTLCVYRLCFKGI